MILRFETKQFNERSLNNSRENVKDRLYMLINADLL